MKKNILLPLLFLVSISLTSNAQADRMKPIFKVKIASPRKDCDSGLNLCLMSDVFNHRQVDAAITSEGNNIHFHLLRTSMSEELENEFLRQNLFFLEPETILPMDMCNKIGVPGETILKQGWYPIQISDDFISITCAIE